MKLLENFSRLCSFGPTLVPTSSVLSWEGKTVDLVSADHPVLSVAQWLDVSLVADLSGLLLATLDVAALLSSLEMSLHLELVDLLRLETVHLLLSWECETIGEFLAIPVCVSLAYLWSHSIRGLSGLLLATLDVAAFLRFLGTSLHLELPDLLRLNMVANLSGLPLATLDVAALLSSLGMSLHLKLAELLRLGVAVLLLDWEKEDIGGLLAIPVRVILTSLLGVVQWLNAFYLALVADLSGLLLAVLDVVILLSSLGTSLHLELADLLLLEMPALCLN